MKPQSLPARVDETPLDIAADEANDDVRADRGLNLRPALVF
jgi:hypothetical protein